MNNVGVMYDYPQQFLAVPEKVSTFSSLTVTVTVNNWPCQSHHVKKNQNQTLDTNPARVLLLGMHTFLLECQ